MGLPGDPGPSTSLTGTAAVPLLLVKLWTVFPRLFLRPPRPSRQLLVDLAERASIAVLVASGVFLLASGLVNMTAWYPWDFSFRSTHYAVAWLAIGSLVVHIAVKLPVIRHALGADIEDTAHDRETATEPGALTRRGLVRTTWAAAGVAVLATAGNSVGWLREVSVLAVRSGEGPQGVPVTRSAAAARVEEVATGDDYRLEVVHGSTTRAVHPRGAACDAAAQRGAPDRLCRGLERVRHLARRTPADAAGRRRGLRATRACPWSRSRSRARSVARRSRETSPTTTAPWSRSSSTASRSTSTTATPRG